MTLASTITSEALPSELQVELGHLIDESGFFQLPSVISSPQSGADRFEYTISIDRPEGSHSVRVTEAAVPPQLRPLIAWLTNAARQRSFTEPSHP